MHINVFLINIIQHLIINISISPKIKKIQLTLCTLANTATKCDQIELFEWRVKLQAMLFRALTIITIQTPAQT